MDSDEWNCGVHDGKFDHGAPSGLAAGAPDQETRPGAHRPATPGMIICGLLPGSLLEPDRAQTGQCRVPPPGGEALDVLEHIRLGATTASSASQTPANCFVTSMALVRE